jgi:hypothetical protein
MVMDRHTDRATDNGTAPVPEVGELLQEIGRDVKTIASHEIELVKNKLSQHVGQAIAKAAVAWLGATVALIGLAMLCVVAVVALEPLLPPLWLRLLVMALVYPSSEGPSPACSAPGSRRTWYRISPSPSPS